jgi:hypothetical protein
MSIAAWFVLGAIVSVLALRSLEKRPSKKTTQGGEVPPTTWPPTSWQPMPAGWRAMRPGELTDAMGAWAYSVLNHRPPYALWSTHEKTFDDVPVLGRVEWHPTRDMRPEGIHRGVTLYRKAN